MVQNFLDGDFDRTIAFANKILATEPNDFEAILFIARAENEKGNFKNAATYLEGAKKLIKEDWQKSWTLLEISKNSFALGNIEDAKKNYNEALQANGTKNSMKELRNFGMLTGLDAFYANWKIRESKNIIFHFEDKISDEQIERIVETRQRAFEAINSFFNSKLPKKIDFFVWNLNESFNPVLNANLGFSNPVFCISHNRLNQTPGHEIAHNISFWKNNNNSRTKFINEGIGVYFDQQKTDKLKMAQEVYKKNPIDIKEIWKTHAKLSDDILYPVSGAFTGILIEYDKAKFLRLNENQTYENALTIYGSQIDEILDGFILKLKE